MNDVSGTHVLTFAAHWCMKATEAAYFFSSVTDIADPDGLQLGHQFCETQFSGV